MLIAPATTAPPASATSAETAQGQEKLLKTARAEHYLGCFRTALEQRHHEVRTEAPPSHASTWAECWFWCAVREIWTDEDFYVHAWAIKVVHELCSLQCPNLAIFGAKQTSKSTTLACFALILFWAFRGKCTVIYRTTTLEEAMQRGWGEIQRLHTAAINHTHLATHYLRSQPPKIVEYQGTSDLKRAIIIKPAKAKAKNGGSGSEFSNIKGFHADVQLVIDDELNELPDNASSAPQALDADYKLFWYVGIGNPTSWDDVLGRLATPTEVTTKEVEQLDLDEWLINRGKALRFAAYKSPNIARGQKPDGTWHYKHLPVPSTYETLIEQCGSEDHPDVWQFGKALPHPEANNLTLLSGALVRQTKADQPATFADMRQVTLGAALDPSFTHGGDDCILQYLQWGRLLDGGWAIEYLDWEKVPLHLGTEDEIFFFVAEQTKQRCLARNIAPENFAFDCTGTGLGLKSILSRVWPGSTKHFVEYGNRPSTRKLSFDDPRMARDTFKKRACEISFKLALYVQYAQIRGLHGPNEIIVKQGTQRRWWARGKFREVESKPDLYQRNSSCDNWDAAAIGSDMLCQKGFIPGGQGGGSAAAHERQTGQHQQALLNAEIHRFREHKTNRHQWQPGTAFNPALLANDDGFDTSDLNGQ